MVTAKTVKFIYVKPHIAMSKAVVPARELCVYGNCSPSEINPKQL